MAHCIRLKIVYGWEDLGLDWLKENVTPNLLSFIQRVLHTWLRKTLTYIWLSSLCFSASLRRLGWNVGVVLIYAYLGQRLRLRYKRLVNTHQLVKTVIESITRWRIVRFDNFVLLHSPHSFDEAIDLFSDLEFDRTRLKQLWSFYICQLESASCHT
jgi:hypothetical protein